MEKPRAIGEGSEAATPESDGSAARGAGARGDRRELWWPSPTVELGRVAHLELGEDGFETVRGARLAPIQVNYESWGELGAARDNVVLIAHTLATDCHVTGGFGGGAPGWWEALIGPGRAIDPARDFVVCPNLLGGCHGTTGPRFPAPDGEPYLDRFPLLTPLDMMRVQRLFLERLGIERVRLVIGPSMGGMVAWEWAIEGGDAVDRVVVVAAPLRTTAYQVGLSWLQRRGVELALGGDPAVRQQGRLIARGIEALSRRSRIGLEEEFGRDWSESPGKVLGERGTYDVESWLRLHGETDEESCDPYTHILFGRAMDLHDVGDGRGGLVAALDRVRCQVVVVGISSDQLYPVAEVRMGADILRHLGRRVSYREMRSPHGHDAFLLETDQLAGILSETPRAPAVAPDPVVRATRTVRLGILGAGRVTEFLLRLLEERRQQHRDDLGLCFEVAAVTEVNRQRQLRLDPIFESVEICDEPGRLVERDDVDVVVDLTGGSGSHALVERALRRAWPVVTPNKALIREHGPALERLATQNGVRLAYRNAIAAGWPLLHALRRPPAGERVVGIQALLSSACNVILESMERGAPLGEALTGAEILGYTEPALDLHISGWDTAQKLIIVIARSCGVRYPVDDLVVQPIIELDPLLVQGAPSAGYHVKLIGLFLDPGDVPVLGVLPAAVRAAGHLGGVHGDSNVVVIEGAEAGEMVYVGKGTGDLPVASAVLGDLVGLFDPDQSWTGRYPAAAHRPRAPRFTRYLACVDARPVVTDVASPGAVPLLETLIHPEPA